MRAIRRWFETLAALAILAVGGATAQDAKPVTPAPYVVVLGVAQDGAVPQAGTKDHSGWLDQQHRRFVVSLGLVDPATNQRWLFEATPDFPEQLHHLDQLVPVEGRPGLDGIFLTHAHMGHYTGLMYLGHEVMGAEGVPVYAMPQMQDFLTTNGPWSQLVKYNNIALRSLKDGVAVTLNERLQVTPFLVPHRQEFSEVVGYRIDGPEKSVLFIPDIDSWQQFDEMGTRIEDLIASVDIAYLDATFYDGNELPGRDMSGFPHPFIVRSMERFADLPTEEKAKVRFIHFNHSNPVLWNASVAAETVRQQGFALARARDLSPL